MTESLHHLFPLALRALGLFLIILANSLVVRAAQHPQDREGWWPMLLRVLGRVSLLRHSDSPGVMHYPFTAQPWPLLNTISRRPYDVDKVIPGAVRLPPPVTKVSVLVPLFLCLYAGCSWLAAHTTASKALTCAGSSIADALLTGLAQELSGQGWQAAATSAAGKALGDALPCAAAALESAGPAPATSTTAALIPVSIEPSKLEEPAHWAVRARAACPGEWKHTHRKPAECQGRPPGHVAAGCVLESMGY